MAKHTVNHIKLGVFVLAGLLFLVVLLYMIGRNRNIFGATFQLKARFGNVQGLVPGNNIRYAGIQVGTVKKINILSDTLLEVIMVIEDKMKPFIHTNAIASIGTEGLMGNKIVNITPSTEAAPVVHEEDMLAGRKTVDTDEMLRTLHNTNDDIAVIAENLKATALRINNSTALWRLLNDNTLPQRLNVSAANLQLATARAAGMAGDLQLLVNDIKNGKGSLGAILTDSSIAISLTEAINKLKQVGERADGLALELDSTVKDVHNEIVNGNGIVKTLLKDSLTAIKLSNTLGNLEKGTDGFNQNMEALKHSFLFRGYFRKLDRQKKAEASRNTVSQ